jgi:hypothetical protein
MGLDFAVDALYATDFQAGEVSSCRTHRDGRAIPTLGAIGDAFRAHGCELSIRHVQLFDCHRAEWRDEAGNIAGAVVGQSAEEAGVYALALLRQQQPARAGREAVAGAHAST